MKVYLIYKKDLIDGIPSLLRIYKNKDFAEKVVSMSNDQSLHLATPYYIEEHDAIDFDAFLAKKEDMNNE